MSEVEEPEEKVEERLRAVETSVENLRGETRALRDDVSALKGDVSTLRGEVGKLRILGEQTAGDVKLLAEVQGRHGEQLEEITHALRPLADLHAFVRAVAHEHEQRITALEKAGGPRGRAPEVPPAG